MIGDVIMRFTVQIALLKQLYQAQLITESEYNAILKTIKNDYKIELTS